MEQRPQGRGGVGWQEEGVPEWAGGTASNLQTQNHQDPGVELSNRTLVTEMPSFMLSNRVATGRMWLWGT